MSEEPTIQQLYERYLEAEEAYLEAHRKSLVQSKLFQRQPIPKTSGNELKLFMYAPLPAQPRNGVLDITAVEVPSEEAS